MDAGDWLLNLTFRQWLDESHKAEAEAFLREAGPVLHRNNFEHQMILRWQLLYREVSASKVFEALDHGAVRSGIEPLQVAALYLFEQMLPQDVRQFGATFKPGLHASKGAPEAFKGRLDDAFPVPMVRRFVRVDLSLPDDVLHADLQRFLRAERLALERLGGEQPYREAARLGVKPHTLQFQALERVGLLPFLDLDRWQQAEGLELDFPAVRGLFADDKDRDKELKRRVELARDQMKLKAWFARIDRSATVTARRAASRG